MFNFVIQNSERKYIPVTEADINRIEEKFGIVFPDILRKYYIEYNGKNIHTVYVPVEGENYSIGVDDIIPLLNSVHDYNIEAIKDDEINYGWVAKELIPFAITDGGDEFYWNADDGRVYAIFADDGEDENGMLIPRYICSSVDELFRRMDKIYEKKDKK